MRQRKLMPETIEEVCAKKRLFMRVLQFTESKEQKRGYEQAVNHCDRLTARITQKAKRLLLSVQNQK